MTHACIDGVGLELQPLREYLFGSHAITDAQQCLTAQAATNGRFVLGVGLSHKLVIEDMMGLRVTDLYFNEREDLPAEA